MLDVPEVVEVVSGWPSLSESDVSLFAADVYDAEPGKQFDLVLLFGL